MHSTNEEILKEILIEVFDIQESENIKNLKDFELIEDKLHWDSLAILSLIAACESEFGIIFELTEYEEVKSIDNIKNVLTRKNI